MARSRSWENIIEVLRSQVVETPTALKHCHSFEQTALHEAAYGRGLSCDFEATTDRVESRLARSDNLVSYGWTFMAFLFCYHRRALLGRGDYVSWKMPLKPVPLEGQAVLMNRHGMSVVSILRMKGAPSSSCA